MSELASIAPHLRVYSFPFRDGYAATAEAVVDTPLEDLWTALLDLEDFHQHVPSIDSASLQWLDDETALCELKGKLGLWKFGVGLDFRYKMRVDHHQRIELASYEGGVFRDVYFLHEVEHVGKEKSRLKSTFYFDLSDFRLISMLKLFERHPWMAEMLNLAATAMMVRSFQLRWEPDEQ